jgi:hypothetical protein
MKEIHYRLATANDADAIFALLDAVAAEIPVLLDLPERRRRVLEQVRVCSGAGESWIAVQSHNRVVGFQLVEPDQLERFHHNNQALHLPYGGVSSSHRGQRIFSTLAGKIMAKGVQLTATVKRANKSDMASRLLKLGFTKVISTDDQDELRWQP